MEGLSSFSPKDGLRAAETEVSTFKELPEGQKKPGDTPENVHFTPEVDTKDLTREEHQSESEYFTDETSIYYQSNDEETEMSDTDDPNLSGLSVLDPDPSLGCLPRRFVRQRSTTWSYVVPEEEPEQRTWKYLMKHNIIRLLEDITVEIFFHRFESPIDYMIEATESARLKNREKEALAEDRRRYRKTTAGSDGDTEQSTSTCDVDAKNRRSAAETTDSVVILFPSQEDYIRDVILVPTQDDISACHPPQRDVTKTERKKKGAEDADRGSRMTVASGEGDHGDDVGEITCFPADPSPLADPEAEVCDVSSLIDVTYGGARVITSSEALELLSYLS